MIELLEKLKKYNYWGNEIVAVGFLREKYLDNVKKYLQNDLIKVVIGQRRTGKSYLLRQIMKEILESGVPRKNIFYLNKEIVDFDSIETYQDLKELIELYKETFNVTGKIYYFFDEIQEIEQWEKIVNSLSQDHKDPAEVFISGSNSHLLSGELSTYLSGRYVEFEILPFSYVEFCGYKKLAANKETLLTYLQTGGLPELFHLQGEETQRHYVEALKNTIILKDIVGRYGIKNIGLLNGIFDYLSDNIGNIFSTNFIVQYLTQHRQKTNFETVSNYIQYLEDVFLIHRVDRYDIKGKSILGGERKYYVNDLSFRNFLFSSFDQGVGKMLENIMYLHYRSQGWQIFVGTLNDVEIDFILERDAEKKYVQVAYALSSEQVHEREFGNLEKIDDSYEKVVVTMDDLSLGNKEGIKHQLAWDVLCAKSQ